MMSRQPRTSAFRLCRLLPCAGLLALAGCHALRLAQVGPDRPEKEKPTVAQAPVPPPTPAPAPPPAVRKAEFRVSPQFVFLHDFEINRNLPLFRELAELREQVYRELQLPPSNTLIYVHLFRDQKAYEQFMQARHPDLPKRRAFFIAQERALGGGEELLVYTSWGERIHQDLRHELTHALLHSVLKDVPIWLDEGLAEYFEMPPGWRGVNYQHLTQLLRSPAGPFTPNLARLEKLTRVEQMTLAEYRESWGWVHLMLHGEPAARQALIGYVRELRTNARPGPLRPRLAAVYRSPDRALHRHLAQIDAARPSATAQR
ncbi:MAG: DUF1570 domain-containing protein [Gemmataceae bacterium]|nr:DUF1570 domain-containing protein [Gemmataceae bacterium]